MSDTLKNKENENVNEPNLPNSFRGLILFLCTHFLLNYKTNINSQMKKIEVSTKDLL